MESLVLSTADRHYQSSGMVYGSTGWLSAIDYFMEIFGRLYVSDGNECVLVEDYVDCRNDELFYVGIPLFPL